MAIEVKFYTFDKELNSTARPAASAGTAYNCELHMPFNILSPTLILEVDGNPTAYNFAYIAEFSRYYVINNWTYDRGLWYAACAVDTLASWKTAIGNTTQYVTRAAAESSGDIIDTLYPATTTVQKTFVEFPTVWFDNPPTAATPSGTYIVGVFNNSGSNLGSVSYYVMNPSQLRAFAAYLMNATDWMEIEPTELSTGLQNALIDPLKYIESIRWYPMRISSTDTVNNLPYGAWVLNGITAQALSGYYFTTSPNTVRIPKHPQAARGSFVNSTPTTAYRLQMPNIGIVDLDPAAMANADSLSVTLTLDLTSGDGIVTAHAVPDGAASPWKEYTIARLRAQIAVPVQLAGLYRDWGAMESLVQQGVSMVGKAAEEFLGDSTIANFASSLAGVGTSLSTTGGAGSYAEYVDKYMYLYATFSILAPDEIARFGRPLLAVRKISTLPGFIQCSSPHLDGVGCTGAERQTLHDYLTSGFYYV